MLYTYIKNNILDLDDLNSDILTSEMTNKNIEFLRYDDNIKTLSCSFLTELSYEDKIILDTIISSH